MRGFRLTTMPPFRNQTSRIVNLYENNLPANGTRWTALDEAILPRATTTGQRAFVCKLYSGQGATARQCLCWTAVWRFRRRTRAPDTEKPVLHSLHAPRRNDLCHRHSRPAGFEKPRSARHLHARAPRAVRVIAARKRRTRKGCGVCSSIFRRQHYCQHTMRHANIGLVR